MSDSFQLRSSDEVATIKKLESIFLPHTSVRREWKRVADNPNQPEAPDNKGKFAHYTSADAALKIISSKRLWMRSTTCMADYREVSHGYDLIGNYFRVEGKRATFLAAMDEVRPGAAAAAAALFDQWWASIKVNTYITSVSDHNANTEDRIGRLSMWRAFGTGQPRVALIFTIPWVSQAALALGITFGPVSYLSEAGMHEALDNCVANVRQNVDWLRTIPQEQFQSWIFNMLASNVCSLKHEGFWEEREWRGVYMHGLHTPSLLERTSEVVGGIPQPVFKIPLDVAVSPHLADLDIAKCLDRIVVGPTSFGWVMYEAFVDALRVVGVPNPEARVWISNLPIREN